jgi:hypothetical protein
MVKPDVAVEVQGVNEAIRDAFIVNEYEPNEANITDVVRELSESTRAIAHAITADAIGGHDATGGRIESLTEAVMGVTAGLVMIAEALKEIAHHMHYSKS